MATLLLRGFVTFVTFNFYSQGGALQVRPTGSQGDAG